MLYAGLDLSRQRLDVHVLDEDGRTVEVTAATPEVFGLRELVARISRHGQEVSATIESMNGARFVHDQLELAGWDVEIADAVKVKGLAPWLPRPTRSTPGSSPSSPSGASSAIRPRPSRPSCTCSCLRHRLVSFGPQLRAPARSCAVEVGECGGRNGVRIADPKVRPACAL
jgi:hypothetical protein